MSDKEQTDTTDAALASLAKKFQVVRDLTVGVAKGYKTGLYLYGNGGVGKSHTVLSQLDALGVSHVLYNSRMTAKGLFLSLAGNPDAIHVLEDMERLTKDPDAQGVLRSALFAQPNHDRVVTWTTAEGCKRATFRGGLILISNRPLADLPELRALATRIEVHRLEVSDAELFSFMGHLASQGYRQGDELVLSAEECLEVTEYLLRECVSSGCPLDLRLQQKSFQTYLQWNADWSESHWRDLISASVREVTHHLLYGQDSTPRDEKRAKRVAAVREIVATTEDSRERVRLYFERTGGSRADFYRLKSQIESSSVET